MRNNIYLAGGGNITQSKLIDTRFFEQIPNNSKILYIPVAMDENHISYDSCYDWFTKLLSKRLGGKEVDFVIWRETDVFPSIHNFHAVYIGGGNTYDLRYIMKKTGIDKILIDFIAKGGLIYGGSAGAILLGESLLPVENENYSNYKVN